jgi:hypothetical protein
MSMDWLVAQARTVDTQRGISVWGVIAVVLTILGGIAAAQQLITWLTGRRRQKALEQVLEDVADKIDAETTEKEVVRLRELAAGIRTQIDNDLPREARRVYLTNRLATIARSIGELYEEYHDIERELQSSRPASPLEGTLRASIEATIMPQYRQRERRDRQLRILLALAVALLLLPVPNDYLRILFFGYFYVVGEAYNYTAGSLVTAVLLAALALSLAGMIAGRRLRFRDRPLPELRRLLLPLAAISFTIGSGLLISALLSRNEAVRQYQLYFEATPGDWSRVARPTNICAALAYSATLLLAVGLSALMLLRRGKVRRD